MNLMIIAAILATEIYVKTKSLLSVLTCINLIILKLMHKNLFNEIFPKNV
jgi:hypothetical protein